MAHEYRKNSSFSINGLFAIKEFRRCVERYNGNHHIRSFSCWDQFLCLAFAQLSYRESLRDIESCLRSMKNKLYHMGIRGNVSRSTLADANENRDWRIYADFAQVLIHIARELYSGDEFAVELNICDRIRLLFFYIESNVDIISNDVGLCFRFGQMSNGSRVFRLLIKLFGEISFFKMHFAKSCAI